MLKESSRNVFIYKILKICIKCLYFLLNLFQILYLVKDVEGYFRKDAKSFTKPPKMFEKLILMKIRFWKFSQNRQKNILQKF